MKSKCVVYFILMFSSITFAQIGLFEKAEDIGNPVVKGSSVYNPLTQSYTLRGGGENIWFNRDEFHFLHRKLKGDFLLTANFKLIGNEEGNGHRKTGWMIRETNQEDAVSINTCIHGDGLAVLQWRLMRGAFMRDPEDELFFHREYFGETVIELERIGQKITMRLSKPGEPFEEMGSITFPDLKDELLAGLYVVAHDPKDTQEVNIWNVRISKPVAPDWHPNRLMKTASHKGLVTLDKLESVDIDNGTRVLLVYDSAQLSLSGFSPDYKKIDYTVNGIDVQMPSPYIIEPLPSAINSSARKTTSQEKGPIVYLSNYKNGSHQIWKSVNGQEEQLSFELGHARDPYLSPDGKYLAYLVYPNTSNPKTPAHFQHMSLKILPTDGGSSRIIAYFFGGSGSLSANSWSADSKKILFLSK